MPVLPHVWAMTLCDEARSRPDGERDLLGVRSHVRGDFFPWVHPQLAVYLELTAPQRSYPCFIVAVLARTSEEWFGAPVHHVEFPGTGMIKPVLFRLRNCRFPEPGLYWIQGYCAEMLVAEHPLQLMAAGPHEE